MKISRILLFVVSYFLSFLWLCSFASGKFIDMDLVVWSSPKLKNRFSIDINERKVVSGDIHIYPLLKPILSGGLLLPNSVEWYNVLTTWVSFCSLVTRLTLERLTGKKSDSLRSGDIPKWDAITLISLGKKYWYLRTVGLLSGSDSIYDLDINFKNLIKKSKSSIWDLYLYDPNSVWFHKGHRFIGFKGSDGNIHIIDPILWPIHAKSKWWHEYFISILELKDGAQLYLGRGYKPKEG